MAGKIKQECQNCKIQFEVWPCLTRIKYCSRKCYWEQMKNQSPWNKGKSLSKTHKEKLSLSHKGIMTQDKHWNWKGGKGTARHRLMAQSNYKLWRIAVFTRDNFTCQGCNKFGVYLQADHIKPWFKFPELRYAIDNGMSLCISCHKIKTKNDRKNYNFFQNRGIQL